MMYRYDSLKTNSALSIHYYSTKIVHISLNNTMKSCLYNLLYQKLVAGKRGYSEIGNNDLQAVILFMALNADKTRFLAVAIIIIKFRSMNIKRR